MPYITQQERAGLARGVPPSGPGQLNYAITKLVARFIRDRGPGYATLNEAIGVLECAKLELYRRLAAPYEDRKAQENGDVYSD